MKKIDENLFFKRTLSFVLSAVCLASTALMTGCRFEHELFGSAASGMSQSSGSEAPVSVNLSSSAVESSVSGASELSESSAQEPEQLSGGNNNEDSVSEPPESSAPETSGQEQESSEPTEDEKQPSGGETEQEQSSSAEYRPLLTNASLNSLGFRCPRDALALIIASPLQIQVEQIAFLDSVTVSDAVNTSIMIVPVYNNSSIELFRVDGESSDEAGRELIYSRDSTPTGYALQVSANSRNIGETFMMVIRSGSFSADYTFVCGRSRIDGGYLLRNNSLERIDYVGDALNAISRKDALSMVVDELTSSLNVTYKWENTSHTSVHLSVEPNSGQLSGEYYIDSNELQNGKGCCYYMISLSQRSYNEAGAAVGERVINRYLVTLPGGLIVPMYDENGCINTEYNDIII